MAYNIQSNAQYRTILRCTAYSVHIQYKCAIALQHFCGISCYYDTTSLWYYSYVPIYIQLRRMHVPPSFKPKASPRSLVPCLIPHPSTIHPYPSLQQKMGYYSPTIFYDGALKSKHLFHLLDFLALSSKYRTLFGATSLHVANNMATIWDIWYFFEY